MAENNSEAQQTNPKVVNNIAWHDDEYDEEDSDQGEEIGGGDSIYL
jgi:hypothetical protein